jgi:uncharacterized Zn finger protein (UPF0148 family)
MEDGGVAGSCPQCGAPHSRGAVFCWQCGATLMDQIPSSAIGDQDATTAVMDALLTSPAAPAHIPDE